MSDFASLKQQGVSLFGSGDLEGAVAMWQQALDLQKDAGVLCNRSAALAKLGRFQEAADDASSALALDPSFWKAHLRLGAAKEGLGDFTGAIEQYDAVLGTQPDNQMAIQGKQNCEAMIGGGLPDIQQYAKLFQDPAVIQRVRESKMTRDIVASDPMFITKLQLFAADPAAHPEVAQTQEFMMALLVAMGLDEKLADAQAQQSAQPEPQPAAEPYRPTINPEMPHYEQDQVEEVDAEEEDEEMAAERRAREEAISRSEALKEEGNALYKARDYDGAIAKYREAQGVCPQISVYYNNEATALISKQDYAAAAEAARKAVKCCRNNRTHYEEYNNDEYESKCLVRLSQILDRLGDLDGAIDALETAQTRKRSRDTFMKLTALRDKRRQAQKQALLDPEAAAQCKQKGDEAFRSHEYAKAVEMYGESLKHAPDQATVFLNRATAFQKMLRIPEALRDCDRAIELDPNYAKAYLRRGQVQAIRGHLHRAIPDLDKAAKLAQEQGLDSLLQMIREERDRDDMLVYQITPEQSKKLLDEDPDLQKLATDPVFNEIVQQCARDPSALAEHMKEDFIREKLEMLIRSGIIRTAYHCR